MENRVKECRNKLGLSQMELAEKSGVSRSTIAEIEAGKRTPGVDIAILLARALGVSVTELFIVA